MSASSIATSVPAPIPIPTFARASAGASFMPSPTIATLWASATSFSMKATLSPGSNSAWTLLSHFLRNHFCDGFVISGEPDGPNTHLIQVSYRFLAFGSYIVRDCDHAAHSAGVGHEYC